MIPDTEMTIDLEIVQNRDTSSNTYKLTKTKIQGFTDGLEALEQAIYKVLSTEKYDYPIYSFSYGIEFENLIGKDSLYVMIELKRRIRECLLEDDRIESINNFKCTIIGDEMVFEFDVVSIYGNIIITKGVNV